MYDHVFSWPFFMSSKGSNSFWMHFEEFFMYE